MKVQVTFEIDDNQRLAIGVRETGRFVPATRNECRDYLTEAANSKLNNLTTQVVKHMDEMRDEVTKTLDAIVQGE